MSGEIENWREEKQAAYLYGVMAEAENHHKHRNLFLNLAKAAEEQADIWAKNFEKSGTPTPSFTPDLRTRIVAALIRWLGPDKIKPVLAAMKVRGLSIYLNKPLLGSLEEDHPMPKSLEEVGMRHKSVGSAGNLRAAIFGINDGLLSNASLIMGVAGANVDNHVILLTGIAGALAGSFSMAAGEYVSVKSQREMYEYQIGLEREELKQYPREEAAELSLIYQSRGLLKAEADRLADKMIGDPERGLDALAREELGLNPDELVSPAGAAISSFLSFAIGSLIPLIPFFFGDHSSHLMTCALLTLTALFLVGMAISLLTGRNALWSGIRMVLIGSTAGMLTYLVGHAFTESRLIK